MSLDPFPSVSLWCVCSFLPKGPRPHLTVHRFGTHRRSPPCNCNGERIAGLQSFRYVQAPLLARPPGCTYRGGLRAPGQPGPFHHAMDLWLPIMNCDIATCPNRAMDTVGLAPTGLRPCRPLPDCCLPALATRRLSPLYHLEGFPPVHNSTPFGAPSRGLPSRYPRLRTAPYGEARGFTTDRLASGSLRWRKSKRYRTPLVIGASRLAECITQLLC